MKTREFMRELLEVIIVDTPKKVGKDILSCVLDAYNHDVNSNLAVRGVYNDTKFDINLHTSGDIERITNVVNIRLYCNVVDLPSDVMRHQIPAIGNFKNGVDLVISEVPGQPLQVDVEITQDVTEITKYSNIINNINVLLGNNIVRALMINGVIA